MYRYVFVLLGLIVTTPAYAQQFDVSNTSVNGKTLTAILGTPTGAMQLPSGTTLQEPDTGNPGELRYNTTTGRFEFGVGGAWDNFVRTSGDTMTGTLTTPSINTGTLNASGTVVASSGTALPITLSNGIISGTAGNIGIQVGNGNTLLVQDGGEGNMAAFTGPASPIASHPVFTAATTGNPVTLSTIGSDTNRGISILPAGTGALTLGVPTGSVNLVGPVTATNGGSLGGEWNNSFFYPTLDTTGTVSDDAALQSEVNACSAAGGTLYLPAGKILLNGSAGTIDFNNCRMVGTTFGGNGTEIDLTSTTTVPFTVGNNWEIENVSFYWPNQTGTVVYPALFQSAPGGAGDWILENNNIINAYDVLYSPAGTGGLNRFFVDGGNYFATDALLKFGTFIGDSVHLTNMHMSPGPWLSRCAAGGASAVICKGYVDAGSTNNSVLHVLNGGNVEIFWSNSATFDWRYGILVDNGGTVTSSSFAIAWDGMGTILDTSAATSTTPWNSADALYAEGHGIGGIHYSYVNNDNSAYYPAFNLGSMADLQLVGGRWSSEGDLVDLTGGTFKAVGATLIAARTGLSSNIYIVNNAISSAGTRLILEDNDIIGTSSYSNGIYSTGLASTGSYVISGNYFEYLGQDINIETGVPTIISGNYGFSTFGTSSVSFGNYAYAVDWRDNLFDKPPLATITGGGTGATVTGTMSGTIVFGTGTVTSVSLTLPFNAPGKAAAGCVFSGVPTTIAVSASGNPPTYALTFGASVAGDTLSYNCAGNQ